MRKEMKATTPVKLGKRYNEKDDTFDDFIVLKKDGAVVFCPSDRFIRKD